MRTATPLVAALALALVAVLACGKKGDPLPPFRKNPRPIPTLELVQLGETVELSFVTPRETVEGAPLPVLDVELVRGAGQGVLAEFGERLTQKAAPGERLTHAEPLPEPGTLLRFAVLTRASGKRSALSPEVALLVRPPPPPPSDVALRLTPEGLALSWTECVATSREPPPLAAAAPEVPEAVAATLGEPAAPPAAPETAAPAPSAPAAEAEPAPSPPRAPPAAADGRPAGAPPAAPPPTPTPVPTPAPPASVGVRLYRRPAQGEYALPLLAAPLATEAYLDAAVEHGSEYCYRLRTILSGQPVVEGLASQEVCGTFLDRQPPLPPEGLSLLRRDEGVELSWSRPPPGGEPLALLRVYRSIDDGPLEALVELTAEQTRWLDVDPRDESLVEYALTATDAVGNESAPSERARIIPR